MASVLLKAKRRVEFRHSTRNACIAAQLGGEWGAECFNRKGVS